MTIDARGNSGGLAIAWDPELLELESFFSSPNSISGNFRILVTNIKGFLTNFYVALETDEKLILIRYLSWLGAQQRDQNWIIGGDFNMITSLTEKKGGTRRLDRDSQAFSTMISDLKLAELETSNGIYTWNNRRGG